MSSVSYQKVPPFPFYSLRQFIQLQPLIRKKTTIYLYQHKSSQQIFAVKQIPYSERTIRIYNTIFKMQSIESIVRLRGLCMMIIKYGWKAQLEQNNGNSAQFSQKKKHSNGKQKESKSLLVFMEKCECDMLELIRYRRKQKLPFKTEEVSTFIRETLYVLENLEKQGVSHRDIKPENFLYDHGRFRLCDFEQAIYVSPLSSNHKEEHQIDLTTLEYTSPEFYKNMRFPKKKIFNPFKLDVYALGITILYMCSFGRFDLHQRRQYLIECSVFHQQFIKEQRRNILKNNDRYKGFNTLVKNMLEEDEYKRDTFQTLVLKMNPIVNIKNMNYFDTQDTNSAISNQTHSSQNMKKKTTKKSRTNHWPGTTDLQRNFLFGLIILGLAFFFLILII